MSRYLAIDLDSQGLYVVAGSARTGVSRVEQAIAWTDENAPPPVLSSETARAIGEEIRDRLKAAGIAPAPVMVSIGRDRVILKEVRYPAVAPSEEAALVRFQVLKEITEAAEDIVLDYSPLPHTSGDQSNEHRAMAVVVRKDVYAAVQAMCNAAGLKLAAVTPRPFAVAAGITRAFSAGSVIPPEHPGDAVAVLTTGPSGGEFTVVRAGLVCFTRAVPAPVLATESQLVNELRRNLTVFSGQNPEQAVRAVYVAEAENAVGGWSLRLRMSLGVPVHPFDPLAGTVDSVAGPLRGRFAGAAGLLAGRATNALPINFAAPRQPQAPRDPRRRQMIIAASVAGVLILLAGVYGVIALESADQELKNLQAEKELLDKSLADSATDVERLKAVDQWSNREVVWLDEIFDLTDRVPVGDAVRLTSISGTATAVDKNGKQAAQARLELKVAAKNADAVTALVGTIERDNPSDKLRYYVATEKRTAGLATGNAIYNQLYTITTLVNRRPPEKYTRFPQFAPPYRKGTGPGTFTTPDEFDPFEDGGE